MVHKINQYFYFSEKQDVSEEPRATTARAAIWPPLVSRRELMFCRQNTFRRHDVNITIIEDNRRERSAMTSAVFFTVVVIITNQAVEFAESVFT